MVENNPRTYRILTTNIETLGCGNRARAMQADALGQTCLLRAPSPADLIFIDPPYRMMKEEGFRQRVLELVARCRSIMGGTGFVVVRSPLGPDADRLEAEGFDGPEVHRYRPDMWVLLYEPKEPGSS